jgi:endonuclease/exonuclease/phosphatase (EEP) superfamily protein YafD
VVRRLAGQHFAHFAAWPIEAAAARKAGGPVILVGDFNATPYSPRFRTLLKEAGVRVAGPRLFWPATWPVGGPLAALPGWPALRGVVPGLLIDHVLVSPRFAVAGFRRGPDIGADHYPLIVDLVLAAKAAGRR